MEIINILKSNELFKELEVDELRTVAELTIIKAVRKNTLVISAGDTSSSIYLIIQGKVKVVVTNEEGVELILATLQQGDNFGELSLLDDQPRSANIIALEDSVFTILHKADFFKLMEKNPKIAMAVIKYLCNRVRFLTNTAQSLALLDVYGRVVNLLHDLSTPKENGQWLVSQPLTHQDIASRVGSSREMISQILNELKKGGYVTIENKIITINRKLPSAW
ncbi:MAG: Crp/Fnr family transcriptional regulator [Methylophilaceae bacterium]|nr:Crp/Fnr family transcriptional regulator [Methylophilaceae bacterium]